MTGHALSVRRLRFRGRIANPLATRGRVEKALAGGGSASQLGKEAILCVRRIAIPLARVDNLSGALGAEIPKAARPARDAVPANANAVLFADRAELLACLARDWCAGHTSASWWWPVLFPRDDFTAVARRAWLEDARSVPTALERLEFAGLAPRFLTKLSPGDVATLWRKLVDTFDLPALEAAWSAPDFAAARRQSRPRHRDADPWASWITPDPSLETDIARLLVTGVLLVRAPAKVRSASFAGEIRAWCQSKETRSSSRLESAGDAPGPDPLDSSNVCRHPQPGPVDASSAVEDPSTKNALPHGEPASVFSRSPHNNFPPDDERAATKSPLTAGEEIVPAASLALLPQARSADSPTRESQSIPPRFAHGDTIKAFAAATDAGSASTGVLLPNATGDGLARFISSKNGETVDEIIALPRAALPNRVATEWGGVLYLAGVAIALEFYGDFTSPARPGLALPLWDFLALVGERFVGEEFKGDPLNRFFARLSGRSEEEAPGADFEVPMGEPLEIWLDRICHDMRARVAASLGVGGDYDLRPLVLNHHAEIEADAARVDAHFSLANHPIELRVAGLDRDPGWVPAAGRSIYFHYD